ncbi:hypothetical protein P029_02970 [Anaplasma phagocytophilum str. Norway variant2]|uniref:Uncharacterized protein n=1 Tax=Anaplasma phagocytophilum str. Norway variant2 TaxID=1392507 RepID=A0A161IGL0_ANAPH|nr:hypothetical protein [Anaplasma phagocytophilum]ANC34319.1 hypothetical protein P029_02970 [Anaplasma phagocytophilum str. Norway variant2]
MIDPKKDKREVELSQLGKKTRLSSRQLLYVVTSIVLSLVAALVAILLHMQYGFPLMGLSILSVAIMQAAFVSHVTIDALATRYIGSKIFLPMVTVAAIVAFALMFQYGLPAALTELGLNSIVVSVFLATCLSHTLIKSLAIKISSKLEEKSLKAQENSPGKKNSQEKDVSAEKARIIVEAADVAREAQREYSEEAGVFVHEGRKILRVKGDDKASGAGASKSSASPTEDATQVILPSGNNTSSAVSSNDSAKVHSNNSIAKEHPKLLDRQQNERASVKESHASQPPAATPAKVFVGNASQGTQKVNSSQVSSQDKRVIQKGDASNSGRDGLVKAIHVIPKFNARIPKLNTPVEHDVSAIAPQEVMNDIMKAIRFENSGYYSNSGRLIEVLHRGKVATAKDKMHVFINFDMMPWSRRTCADTEVFDDIRRGGWKEEILQEAAKDGFATLYYDGFRDKFCVGQSRKFPINKIIVYIGGTQEDAEKQVKAHAPLARNELFLQFECDNLKRSNYQIRLKKTLELSSSTCNVELCTYIPTTEINNRIVAKMLDVNRAQKNDLWSRMCEQYLKYSAELCSNSGATLGSERGLKKYIARNIDKVSVLLKSGILPEESSTCAKKILDTINDRSIDDRDSSTFDPTVEESCVFTQFCAVYSNGNELFNDLSLRDRKALVQQFLADSSFRAALINHALHAMLEFVQSDKNRVHYNMQDIEEKMPYLCRQIPGLALIAFQVVSAVIKKEVLKKQDSSVGKTRGCESVESVLFRIANINLSDDAIIGKTKEDIDNEIYPSSYGISLANLSLFLNNIISSSNLKEYEDLPIESQIRKCLYSNDPEVINKLATAIILTDLQGGHIIDTSLYASFKQRCNAQEIGILDHIIHPQDIKKFLFLQDALKPEVVDITHSVINSQGKCQLHGLEHEHEPPLPPMPPKPPKPTSKLQDVFNKCTSWMGVGLLNGGDSKPGYVTLSKGHNSILKRIGAIEPKGLWENQEAGVSDLANASNRQVILSLYVKTKSDVVINQQFIQYLDVARTNTNGVPISLSRQGQFVEFAANGKEFSVLSDNGILNAQMVEGYGNDVRVIDSIPDNVMHLVLKSSIPQDVRICEDNCNIYVNPTKGSDAVLVCDAEAPLSTSSLLRAMLSNNIKSRGLSTPLRLYSCHCNDTMQVDEINHAALFSSYKSAAKDKGIAYAAKASNGQIVTNGRGTSLDDLSMIFGLSYTGDDLAPESITQDRHAYCIEEVEANLLRRFFSDIHFRDLIISSAFFQIATAISAYGHGNAQRRADYFPILLKHMPVSLEIFKVIAASARGQELSFDNEQYIEASVCNSILLAAGKENAVVEENGGLIEKACRQTQDFNEVLYAYLLNKKGFLEVAAADFQDDLEMIKGISQRACSPDSEVRSAIFGVLQSIDYTELDTSLLSKAMSLACADYFRRFKVQTFIPNESTGDNIGVRSVTIGFYNAFSSFRSNRSDLIDSGFFTEYMPKYIKIRYPLVVNNCIGIYHANGPFYKQYTVTPIENESISVLPAIEDKVRSDTQDVVPWKGHVGLRASLGNQTFEAISKDEIAARREYVSELLERYFDAGIEDGAREQIIEQLLAIGTGSLRLVKQCLLNKYNAMGDRDSEERAKYQSAIVSCTQVLINNLVEKYIYARGDAEAREQIVKVLDANKVLDLAETCLVKKSAAVEDKDFRSMALIKEAQSSLGLAGKVLASRAAFIKYRAEQYLDAGFRSVEGKLLVTKILRMKALRPARQHLFEKYQAIKGQDLQEERRIEEAIRFLDVNVIPVYIAELAENYLDVRGRGTEGKRLVKEMCGIEGIHPSIKYLFSKYQAIKGRDFQEEQRIKDAISSLNVVIRGIDARGLDEGDENQKIEIEEVIDELYASGAIRHATIKGQDSQREQGNVIDSITSANELNSIRKEEKQVSALAEKYIGAVARDAECKGIVKELDAKGAIGIAKKYLRVKHATVTKDSQKNRLQEAIDSLNTVTEAMARRATRAQGLVRRYLSSPNEEMKMLLQEYIDARGKSVERSRIIEKLLSIDALDMAIKYLEERYKYERGTGSQRESQLLEALDALDIEKKRAERLKALNRKNAFVKKLVGKYCDVMCKDAERKEILEELKSMKSFDITIDLDLERSAIKHQDSKRAELLKEIIDALEWDMELEQVDSCIANYTTSIADKNDVLRAEALDDIRLNSYADLAMSRLSKRLDAATEDQDRERLQKVIDSLTQDFADYARKSALVKELVEKCCDGVGKDAERKEILKELKSLKGADIMPDLCQEYDDLEHRDSKRAELLKETIDSLERDIEHKKADGFIVDYKASVLGKDDVLRAKTVDGLHEKNHVDLAMSRLSEMRDAATEDQDREQLQKVIESLTQDFADYARKNARIKELLEEYIAARGKDAERVQIIRKVLNVDTVMPVKTMLIRHVNENKGAIKHEMQRHLAKDICDIERDFEIIEEEQSRTKYLADKYLCAGGISKDAERRWIAEELCDMDTVQLAIDHLYTKCNAAENIENSHKDLIRKSIVDLARDCENREKIMARAERLAIRCIRESNTDEVVEELQTINGLDIARKYLTVRFLDTGETLTHDPKQGKIRSIIRLLEYKKGEEEVGHLITKYLAIGTSAERAEMLKALNTEESIATKDLLVREYANNAQGSQQDLIKEAIDTLQTITKTTLVHQLVGKYLASMGDGAARRKIADCICAMGIDKMAGQYLIEKRDAAIEDQDIETGVLLSEFIEDFNQDVAAFYRSIALARELEKKYADSVGGEGVLREQITDRQYAQGTTDLAESSRKVEHSATKSSQEEGLQEAVNSIDVPGRPVFVRKSATTSEAVTRESASASTSQGLDARSANVSAPKDPGRESASASSSEDLDARYVRVCELSAQYTAAIARQNTKKREQIIEQLCDMDAVHMLVNSLKGELEVAKHNRASGDIERLQEALNTIPRDEKAIRAARKPVFVRNSATTSEAVTRESASASTSQGLDARSANVSAPKDPGRESASASSSEDLDARYVRVCELSAQYTAAIARQNIKKREQIIEQLCDMDAVHMLVNSLKGELEVAKHNRASGDIERLQEALSTIPQDEKAIRAARKTVFVRKSATTSEAVTRESASASTSQGLDARSASASTSKGLGTESASASSSKDLDPRYVRVCELSAQYTAAIARQNIKKREQIIEQLCDMDAVHMLVNSLKGELEVAKHNRASGDIERLQEALSTIPQDEKAIRAARKTVFVRKSATTSEAVTRESASASTSQGLDARSASASTSKGLGTESASASSSKDLDPRYVRVCELSAQYTAAIARQNIKKREQIIEQLCDMDAVHMLVNSLKGELEVAKHNRASGDIERLQEALSTIPQDEKAIRAARKPVFVRNSATTSEAVTRESASASTSQGLDARSASASTSKGLGRETASASSSKDLDARYVRVCELSAQYTAAIARQNTKKREQIIKQLCDMDAVHMLVNSLKGELEVAKHNRASGDIERLQEALSTIPQDEKAIRAARKTVFVRKSATTSEAVTRESASASTSQGLDARSASASTSKGLGTESASASSSKDLDPRYVRVCELSAQYTAAIARQNIKKREQIIEQLCDMDAVHMLVNSLKGELEVAKHNRASGDIERLQEALNTIPRDEKAVRARNPVAVGAKTAIGLPQSESSIKYAASMEKGTGGIVPSVLHMKGNAALAGDDNVRGTA